MIIKPKNKTRKNMIFFFVYLRDLMRDPPDKTTLKAPLSFENLSDRSAVYFARDTARSSSVSNTSTFFLSPPVSAVVVAIDAFTPQQPNFLFSNKDTPFSLKALRWPIGGRTDFCGATRGEIMGGEIRTDEESVRKEVGARAICIMHSPLFL
jgi:hypothetical protein